MNGMIAEVMDKGSKLLLEKIVCLLLIMAKRIKSLMKPTCILNNLQRYEEMIELLEDSVLFFEAERRMRNAEADGFISHEQMLNSLGINESELANVNADI
jgi:hypothetical protein